MGKIDVSPTKVVEEATRCHDCDVPGFSERHFLTSEICSTDEEDLTGAGIFGIGHGSGESLVRKLSCWGKDENPEALLCCSGLVNPVKGRKEEPAGFSCSGSGDAEYVPSFDDQGNGGCLNRGGNKMLDIIQCFQYFWSQTKIGESDLIDRLVCLNVFDRG